MGLTLLLGLEGKKKTEYLASRISSGGKTRILVPDQYTMAAENRYLSLVGEERLAFAEILSFKRFASRVFEQAGGLAFELIGDGGRQALLSKAVHEVSPFFRYYPRDYYSMKFVRLIMPMIRNLKTAGVTPSELEKTATKEKNAKLLDISLIYGCFETLLTGGFFDPDDNFTRLCRLLGRKNFFRDSVFFVDFFRTFNSGERRVIKALLAQGAEVFVCLPCEKLSSQEDFGRLSEVELCGGKLRGLAESCGCECKTLVFSCEGEEKPEELRFLSKHLFSEKQPVFNGCCEGIRFYSGTDLFDEIEFVASEIMRLVREEGARYSDFVVAARNIDDYAGVLDPVFAEYGIPVFFHRKTPLIQKSTALFVVTVLEILASGFTPQNVLTCLKTGFFGYPEEDIRLFENYLSLWSVRPSGLEKPFVYPVRGMTKRRGEQDEQLLARIEFLRRDFTGRLLDLRRQTEGKTVREISERLYSFLLSLGIEEHMRDAAELYLKFGEQALYAEHLQVYDLILESLDEIVLTCGKDVLTLTEYADLVLSVLDSKDIAILPTAADEVMTGNMNRLPYLGQKILFAVGLSEGVFPETPSGDALLSETDKALLNQNDITVGMTNRQKVMYERLLAFFTFTAPEKTLYLTCPEKDRPSPFWREIRRMFPLAQVSFSPIQSGGKALENRICTERSAFSVYAKTKIEPLAQIFEKSPRYRRLLQRRTGRDTLSPAVSRGLFGTDILLSPSKAERFFQCPFSYFLSEGLGISAPETVRIGGVQLGNFMHEALEKLLPAALAGTPSGELVQGFSSVYLEELFGGEAPTASVREYFAMLEQKAGRLLQKLCSEIPVSGFVPIAYEAGIGRGAFPSFPRKVGDGTVSVRGKVDRIDCFSSDREYLRIVDYKTGEKTVSLEKIENGTEMQMPLYLAAVLSASGEKSAPAGILYLRANPKIRTVLRHSSPEMVDRAVWEKSVSGLILDRPEVLAAAGETAEKMQRLSEEAFGALFKTVEKNVDALASALMDGKVPIAPVSLQRRQLPGRPPCPESCRYCFYEPYCNAAQKKERAK